MKTMGQPTVVVAFLTVCLGVNSLAVAAWPWSSTQNKTLPLTQTSSTPLSGGKPLVTQAGGPSAWQKISTGTKKVATGTVDVLTLKPIRDKWATDKTPKRDSAGYNIQPKKKSESSWFGSWFKPKEEKKIKTVGDWMAQPQPRM